MYLTDDILWSEIRIRTHFGRVCMNTRVGQDEQSFEVGYICSTYELVPFNANIQRMWNVICILCVVECAIALQMVFVLCVYRLPILIPKTIDME